MICKLLGNNRSLWTGVRGWERLGGVVEMGACCGGIPCRLNGIPVEHAHQSACIMAIWPSVSNNVLLYYYQLLQVCKNSILDS